jgi:hypothetical protein
MRMHWKVFFHWRHECTRSIAERMWISMKSMIVSLKETRESRFDTITSILPNGDDDYEYSAID